MLSDPEIFASRLQLAVSRDFPYLDRPVRMTGSSREAAVLVLFGYERSGLEKRGGEPFLLMTKRTETVETHKGQMAFPGGVYEEGEDCFTAALRESQEEVGLPPEGVRTLGELPPLVTPTGFSIAPVVGLLKTPISETPLLPNPAEIATAFWIPFSVLSHADTYRRELIRAGEINYPIHVFQVGEHRIWGATGSIIKNLLDRLASLS